MENNLRRKFEIGEIVLLDADKASGSKVTVVSQTPQQLFTTVTSSRGNQWDVMTIRLSKYENKKNP